jgi:NADH-quinone oxidoreductase subunit G
MCLVQVEKAPKPLPACATPAAEGMKVWTQSEQAKKAQQGVMEFLLINHPLDCPICDQGGECQLQDLAVGYGGSASRYTEAKRVVFHKNLGPLVAAEEMARCIQCTRCVRFGQEIAGVMELGMIGRGEHAEIVAFVGQGVNSELSGNMIDVCPVGALTSKPFRYAARTWELARRRSVSPHDSLGSNLIVQAKGDRVLRVVPYDNPAVNECWISDKDRFSYEGLASEDRLAAPMIKEDGEWQTVDWPTALGFVAGRLKAVVEMHGGPALGTLVSPHATLEEMALSAALTRALGSDNIDFRLRQSDFRSDGHFAGFPWLGMPIAEIDSLDRALVIGSFLRKDHPLLAQRLRHAARKGAEVSVLHSVADDSRIRVTHSLVAPPSLCPRRSPKSWSPPQRAPASPFHRRSRTSSPLLRRRSSPRASFPASTRQSCSETTPNSIRKRRSSSRWRRRLPGSSERSWVASPRRRTASEATCPMRSRRRRRD